MIEKLPFKLAGLIGLILLADNTWAQNLSNVSLPGAAQPEQVGRAITSQLPREHPSVLPPVLKPESKPTGGLGEQAKQIKFKLNGIILEGNRTISSAELRQIYAKQMHKTISIADLFEIVQAITNYYRNQGYILSRAILPPQHVKNGVVRIKIIEGYIGKVSVSGNPYGARRLVQAIGCRIKDCPPLKLSRMEHYLLIANEIPATSVRAVLAPSQTEVGAADLTLVTDNDPVTAFFTYDNYGTRYIGPQQMTGNIALNSLITSGDSTNFTMTKTPKGGELTYTDVNYNMALDAEGDRWTFGATRVHTHPLFVLRPVQIDGLNDNYYTTFFFPIIRERSKSLTLRLGFNYLDSTVTTFDLPLYTDHIRSLDFGGTYNWADSYNGSNLISADIRQGLPIFGYTSDTNVETAQTSRPGGRAVYTKLNATVSRLQAIYGPFSLFGLFMGQASSVPLLAAEQFTFGGSQLGRGYDVAEIIGDRGMAGTLELREDLSFTRLLQNIQVYQFYDVGAIWNYKFIGGVPRKVSAASFGIGARFFFTRYISGNMMWTQPITKSVAAEELIGNGHRPRMFFSVVATLD